MLGEALKGLPRDSYQLMSKVTTFHEGIDPQAKFDELRRTSQTEYFDIMLLHWQHTSRLAGNHETLAGWHPRSSAEKDHPHPWRLGAWTAGIAANAGHQLARRGTDPHQPQRRAHGWPDLRGHQPPRQCEAKWSITSTSLKKEGLGVIGMKLCGGGQFQNSHDDRVKAMRFAFQNAGVDSATIGFKSTQEIDEAIST